MTYEPTAKLIEEMIIVKAINGVRSNTNWCLALYKSS